MVSRKLSSAPVALQQLHVVARRERKHGVEAPRHDRWNHDKDCSSCEAPCGATATRAGWLGWPPTDPCRRSVLRMNAQQPAQAHATGRGSMAPSRRPAGAAPTVPSPGVTGTSPRRSDNTTGSRPVEDQELRAQGERTGGMASPGHPRRASDPRNAEFVAVRSQQRQLGVGAQRPRTRCAKVAAGQRGDNLESLRQRFGSRTRPPCESRHPAHDHAARAQRIRRAMRSRPLIASSSAVSMSVGTSAIAARNRLDVPAVRRAMVSS